MKEPGVTWNETDRLAPDVLMRRGRESVLLTLTPELSDLTGATPQWPEDLQCFAAIRRAGRRLSRPAPRTIPRSWEPSLLGAALPYWYVPVRLTDEAAVKPYSLT